MHRPEKVGFWFSLLPKVLTNYVGVSRFNLGINKGTYI